MNQAKARLEFDVINAGIGDAFVIRYSDEKGKNRAILIDGGDGGIVKGKVEGTAKPPPGQKSNHLRPWLEKLKNEGYEELELLVVTHIDSDHIGGLVDFFGGKELPLNVKNLWFNWPVMSSVDEDWQAPASWAKLKNLPVGIEESIKQAKSLMTLAKLREDMAINGPYFSYLTSDVPKCVFNGVLEVTVLGPTPDVFGKFKTFMSQALKGKGNAAVKINTGTATGKDTKLINVVSIVLLFEYTLGEKKRQRLLLTGDGRDDLILKAMKDRGLLEKEPFEVDLLKLPHHGSKNNNSGTFFDKIKPRYVVLSTNGEKHHHPDPETLNALNAKYGAGGPYGEKPWFFHSVPIVECVQNVQARLSAAKVHAPQAGGHGQTIVLIP